jgi:hypothetical protein
MDCLNICAEVHCRVYNLRRTDVSTNSPECVANDDDWRAAIREIRRRLQGKYPSLAITGCDEEGGCECMLFEPPAHKTLTNQPDTLTINRPGTQCNISYAFTYDVDITVHWGICLGV